MAHNREWVCKKRRSHQMFYVSCRCRERQQE